MTGEREPYVDGNELQRLYDERDALREQVAKQTKNAAVDKAFYDLTIAQRNLAWREVEVLRAAVAELALLGFKDGSG